MRVLILSQRGMANGFTGDSTQMHKTIASLRKHCSLITHVYVDHDGSLYDANDKPTKETLQSLCEKHDVVHQLPRLNYRTHKAIEMILSSIPVLISTVYWHDFSRIIIAWRNGINLKEKLLSAIKSCRVGSKNIQNYSKSCNILLPNSWAEGQNVKKHFKLSKDVCIWPVPNGFDFTSFDLNELHKPNIMPYDDYIVCPAVFSPRKNQLGLIKAMKGSDLPIVFMGGMPSENSCYWQECKRLATKNMFFIEHQSNNEPNYWAILKYARCACLPSDCETPGIALLEAAAVGARPIITSHGGTFEYYGLCAEYFEPTKLSSIRSSIERAWQKGRLSDRESRSFLRFSWDWTAELTVAAYQFAITTLR